MRNALLILITIFSFVNSAPVLAQDAEFNFEKKVLKFPKTPEGEVLHFEYPFENSGKVPLIIEKIDVACSCTKYIYPQKPLLPGEKGVIKVSFDTNGKIGYQDRILEIYANIKKSPEKIRFKVVVDNKSKK